MTDNEKNPSANVIFALCMLATLEAKIASNPVSILLQLAKIKAKGLEMEQIYLNRIAGGMYCEALEQFLGASLLGGLLAQRDPILITPKGYLEYKEMVNGAGISELLPIANEIGIKIPIK